MTNNLHYPLYKIDTRYIDFKEINKPSYFYDWNVVKLYDDEYNGLRYVVYFQGEQPAEPQILENFVANNVKYKIFSGEKETIEKLFWNWGMGKKHYQFIFKKRIVKKYVPNEKPIKCLDSVLISDKVIYNDKIIPFTYTKEEEWKEYLEGLLKEFQTGTNEPEPRLVFEDYQDIDNFKAELENIRKVLRVKT